MFTVDRCHLRWLSIIRVILTDMYATSASDAGRVGPKIGHNTKAVDLAPQIGVQKLLIVPEGHASIRLAVRTQHVGMRKHTIATKHLTVFDWMKANGPYAMERLLSQCKLIDIRRRRTAYHDVTVTRIVQLVAQARMRLKPVSVGQIHGACGDVINRRTGAEFG